jgi:GDP-mannose 6-dehydrogenase
MRVSVLGLGYVGAVSAVCLAARGHRVVGADVEPAKVEMIRRGVSPVVEELIGELTAEVVRDGSLRATSSIEEALRDSEITLVCVGTPSAGNGSVFTGYLERVAEQIGEALGKEPVRACSSRSWSAARGCAWDASSAWPSTPSSCARAAASATSTTRR